MATIGVTRGLGDHDLKVFSSNIHIKPFLSCFPEVSLALAAPRPRAPVRAGAGQGARTGACGGTGGLSMSLFCPHPRVLPRWFPGEGLRPHAVRALP